MTLFRRVCVLLALMLWQGGFVFYGGIVVPVGAEVLGSHSEQGWVTRSVTNYLNLVGLFALLIWAWDLVKIPGRLRWALWLLLAASLAALAGFHVAMDGLLDAENRHILDRPTFRRLHSWYLIVSTVQWLVALVLLVLTLAGWQRQDAPRSHDPV